MTKGIWKLIAGCAVLACLAACISPKPSALVAFKKAYNKIHPQMGKEEVVALLGEPHIQTDMNEDWGLTSPTIATYASPNREGTRALAMIVYLGDCVVSKSLTYVDLHQATPNAK